MRAQDITSSDFSAEELYSCLSFFESKNLTKESFTRIFDNQIKGLSSNSYDFSFAKKEKNYFISNVNKYEVLFQKLVLRKIYQNIKAEYKFIHPNRDEIISQIINLTKDKNPYWIQKLDIKSFFESVKRDAIIQKLKQDYRLTRQTIILLEKIFTNQSFNGYTGLPRGLSISSILAEIYLNDFDSEITRTQGVFYYARYVDDIIIFCTNKQIRDDVKNIAIKALEELRLFTNCEKNQSWDNNSTESLKYLGYEFKHDTTKKVTISIATNKVNKIKTHITRSFFDFIKNHNYNLLDKRIKYLSGNCIFDERRKSPIFAGIYYNYKRITEKNSLKELDTFYRGILNCKKGKLGTPLNQLLNATKRNHLKKYSFMFGHEKHLSNRFSSKAIKEITQVW